MATPKNLKPVLRMHPPGRQTKKVPELPEPLQNVALRNQAWLTSGLAVSAGLLAITVELARAGAIELIR